MKSARSSRNTCNSKVSNWVGKRRKKNSAESSLSAKIKGKTQQILFKEIVYSNFLYSQVKVCMFSFQLNKGAFLLMQNTSY